MIIQRDELDNIWTTSDTHFGHLNIIRYCNRPYKDVEEMAQDLINKWNQTVPEGAVVYHLGDVCMGSVKENLPLVRQLNGTKILILGNHDRPYPGAYKDKKREEWLAFYKDCGFEEIHDDLHVSVEGFGDFWFNHVPYPNAHPSHEADRSSYERRQLIIPEDKEIPLLCGHVHTSWRTIKSALGTPMYNVGTDLHGFSPIPLGQVLMDPIFKD